jgi:hypothetical protein
MFRTSSAKSAILRVLADAAFAVIVAVVLGLVLASLTAAGVITMTLAIFYLVGAWTLAVGATFLLTHLWDPSPAHRAIFAAVLAALFCGIVYLESLYQVAPPLLIEIQIGPTLSKLDPKETRFIVTNNSEFPIVDMHYYCTIRPGLQNRQKGAWFSINVLATVTIKPKSNQGLYCGSSIFNFEDAQSALWAINLMFKKNYPPGDTEFGAIYLMKRDANGEVKWIPEGTVAGLREAFEFLGTHDAQ